MNGKNPHQVFENGFEIPAIRMLPYWRIRFVSPADEVDRVFDEIVKVAPLIWGKTDRNAIRTATCHEYYRPMEGARTGAESETRKRPGVVELSMTIPPDRAQLERIIDVIYQYHSYYEPPISVEPILRSETRGLDDADNPNRWWNNAGDWKNA